MQRGRLALAEYAVTVTIENKPSLRDPEGESILRDLIAKNGFSSIKNIRTAKQLKMTVEADNETIARQLVTQICNDLRIYNPLVSLCSVTVEGSRV